jgi:BirA family biotin operon repressor/biotin-[acetyl-CoA-carboxylase] ligase
VPLGAGICLSVGWRFSPAPAEAAALPLAVGVAVRRVLERMAEMSIELKWPNDLVFDGRKLGGILVETSPQAHGGMHVVAGVGLNVALPPQLLASLCDWPRGATDLKSARGRDPPRRVALVGALVNELAALLFDYAAAGFAPYRREWRAADYLHGQPVRLDAAAGRMYGTACGIDASGALLVESEQGDRRRIVAGEVSVRSCA